MSSVTERGRRLLKLGGPRSVRVIGASLSQRTTGDDREHLGLCLDWLGDAHDATKRRGVAARFDLADGWDRAYPETTGYIISTLLEHDGCSGTADQRARAISMGEWLLTVQAPEGWIPAGLARPGGAGRPEVFNTGQVVFGLVALAEVTGEERFAAAASRACRWLADVQEADGSWIRASLHEVPHAYYTRVAWAMARAGVVLDDERFRRSAGQAVTWTVARQQANGWIDCMSFTPDSPPLTHTIAYTVEGLIECGVLLGDDHAVQVAARAVDAIATSWASNNSGARTGGRRASRLAATFADDWTSRDRYSCVVGNAQLALCASRLDAVLGRSHLRSFADDMVESAKRAQPRTGPLGVRGGVPGSDPLWGSYGSFRYINWGAKFLADALLHRVNGGLPEHRFG